MAEVRFTVFTPVYNRRHTIHRVFDSLMRQTCMDFEWLVIDDGSTDDLKPLIEEYAAKAPFRVRYYYKENGGKHTAINMAYGLIETPYFTILDSDDAFTDTAVERMLAVWDSVAPKQREQYWCVVGHCLDSVTRERIGDAFPENANEPGSGKPIIRGEKMSALRTDILRRYPFPEPEGTTFVTESVVWNKLDRDYLQYYVNEDFRIYYQNEPDSLVTSWYRNHVKEGYVSNFIWKQSQLNDVGIQSKSDVFQLFQYTFYGVMAGRSCKEITSGLEKKAYRLACALLIVPAKAVRMLRKIKG